MDLKVSLAPEAKVAHKLWSVQLLLFSAGFEGLWWAMPAFQELLPPLTFALCCVGISLLICICRLINQPGVPNG